MIEIALFAVLTAVAPGAAPRRAQVAAPAAPLVEAVPESVSGAMVRGDWEGALSELDRLDTARPEAAELWGYLRAVALEHGGRDGEALEVLAGLEERFPNGEWVHKARFRKAEILRRAGRMQEAEAVWEAETERLSGQDRKRELAELYLAFADELSTATGAPDHQLDYERAHALYGKAIELDAPRDVQDRALFRMGLCREAQERWSDVEATWSRYLERFDPSVPGGEAAQRGAGQHVLEARRRRGSALLALGRPDEARRVFEDLVGILDQARDGVEPWRSMFGEVGSERRAQALRTCGDAAFAIASTWPPRDAAQTPLAIAALQRFLKEFPEHPQAAQAAFDVADRQRELGRGDEALEAFAEFLERPLPEGADAQTREEAARLKQRALFLIGQIHLDRAEFDPAIETWSRYVALHPSGADWSAAQRGLVEAEFARAEWLEREERRPEARQAFARFLEDHPLDARAEQIGLRIGELWHAQGRAEAEAEGQEDRGGAAEAFRAAIAQWRRLAKRYPGSDTASRALFRVGQTLEEDLRQPEQAIAAYRECNFGPFAGRAATRLSVMTEPELSVRTERSWRTSEPARIAVDTRNVETLAIEIYELDLEAYFRKHLSIRSVESLDVDLIAPDQRLEVPVANYEPYAPLHQNVTLPVEGPGVWVVVVEAQELRATTLVLQSDLDVIVKSSRREVFVWAQDRLSGKPAEGARVLVAIPGDGSAPGSDSEPLLREVRTDADGVARVQSDRLAAGPEVRVLAVRDGHCAAEGLGLGAVGLAAGLTPRGFLYTDRPAYQPGQTVGWRALVRSVENGRFGFRPGRRYRVEIADPRGRVLFQSTAELSEFGTLSGTVELGTEAVEGTWRVHCQAGNDPAIEGHFEVARYTLRHTELTLTPERPVWYRGETVGVDLEAAWYYGEPLAGAPVGVQLPDGRQLELATDAQGHARFSFPTRDFPHEGELRFRAWLPAEGVQASGSVWLALRGYDLEIETARDVVLPRESFDVEVRAELPGGEPAQRVLALTVARAEPRAEVEVLRRELETDAAGRARVTLTLERGGDYVLRAEGNDRFGNPVLARARLHVSGDDDASRLLFLADTHELHAGQDARVTLLNRTGAGLALLTWEAEGVVDYRLAELREGPNEIEFDVADDLAPGVALAAARMAENRLYTASAPFQVVRELHVTVTPEKDELAPGQPLAVALEVTDAAGQPAEAELSLAVVDEALFDLYASFDPTAIQRLFDLGRRHAGGVVTVSSAGFGYRGVTTAVDTEILAERARSAAERNWRARHAQAQEALGQIEEEGSEDFILGKTRAPVALPGPTAPEEAFNDMLGVGGGAGGALGRRGGRPVPAAAGQAALRARLAETAYWSPAIRTDSEGHARVELTMPDQATRWRLTAVGAGRTPVFGGGTATVTTRRQLFVELSLPGALTEGDAPRILARVHDESGAPGTARLVLRVGRPDQPLESFPAELELDGTGVAPHLFEPLPPIEGARPLVVEAEVTAHSGGRTLEDRVRRVVPVRPWGLEHVAVKSGPIQSDATFWVELPSAGLVNRVLDLSVGPGLARELIELALGQRRHPLLRGPVGWPPTRAATGAELLGVSGVLRWLEERGDADPDLVRQLSGRASGLVAELVSSQRDDGGWSWVGTTKLPSPEVSALAMLALANAAEVGLAVPPETVARGADALAGAFARAPRDDDETRALLALALAAHDRADFGALNQLHRRRTSLSPAALAYATLALARSGRAPMAADLARLLEQRAVIGADPELVLADARTCQWPGDANGRWNRSTVESTAWALMAIESALPRSERAAQAADWLSARVAFAPDRARGIALMALAAHRAGTGLGRGNARAVILVEGQEVGRHSFGPDSREPLELTLPVDPAAPSRLRVDVRVEGTSGLFLTAALRGFAPGAEAPAPPDEFQIAGLRYLAAPPRLDGRELPEGFSVLSRLETPGEPWENEVARVTQGETLRARLDFWVDPQRAAAEPESLALEIPLPAGADLLDGSVRGALAHELRDGRLRLLLGQRPRGGQVEFTLVGARPGHWRALPPRLESLYESGRRAFGPPLELSVLPRGERASEPYRPTPDELYNRGRLLFEAGRRAEAWEPLQALSAGFGDRLRPEVLADTARMLLALSIERGQSRAVVQAFEVLREKSPELTIPFDQVRAVGAAYRDLEEWERALLVFRAVVEETFGKDLKVAGALDQVQEHSGAIDVMGRLWREYPDLSTVTEALLALSEKVLVAAPSAAADESLRRAGRDRAELSLEGILLLRRFLALFPRDPLAPEAGLNLVSALLDLEDYPRAASTAAELAQVYSEPHYKDAFGYSQAVAEWYLGQDDRALELLRSIAVATYPDELGEPQPSANRDLARYILGQIWHARGNAREAQKYYQEVADQFADAREALAGLREQRVHLPELETFAPGQTVTLEIEHKNVSEAELLVYAVDLMTLALREKNLSNVTAVDLAGIAPALRRTVALPEGSGLLPQTSQVELELSEPGAYLVICRAGEQFASGLVLVTDLALGVREDASAGRLRIEAWRRSDGAFLRDVDVRVIGSGNQRFQSGRTDPRGLFVAEGLAGTTTVIARLGEHDYAFHRGETVLGQAQSRDKAGYKSLEQQDYLRNVLELNRVNQETRAKWLEDEIRRERKGVQVQQVK